MLMYRLGEIVGHEWLEEMVHGGALVPVEPCEHGNYAPHPVVFMDGLQDFIGECDGGPKSRGVEPEAEADAALKGDT